MQQVQPGGSTAAHEISEAAEHGLYNAAHEHDACGVGFVAHIKGQRRTASSSRA